MGQRACFAPVPIYMSAAADSIMYSKLLSSLHAFLSLQLLLFIYLSIFLLLMPGGFLFDSD